MSCKGDLNLKFLEEELSPQTKQHQINPPVPDYSRNEVIKNLNGPRRQKPDRVATAQPDQCLCLQDNT